MAQDAKYEFKYIQKDIIMSNVSWAENEFKNADLGDKRRTERLIDMAETFAQNPQASFPEACRDNAQLKAAYRFFDNEQISAEAILDSHTDATISRLSEEAVILAPQDTSLLDWTDHPSTTGLGPLASEHQQGLLAHSTLALTEERVALGVLDQQVWARDSETYGKQDPNRPIEEKESYKWLKSLDAVNQIAQKVPGTHFISIGDREADVYDLFIRNREKNLDLLVRASWDRRVEHPQRYLWTAAKIAPVVGKAEVKVNQSQTQEARMASLTVRSATVIVRRPRKRSKKWPNVTLTLVYAVEENPPAGSEPLEWLLLTTMKLENGYEAIKCLDWYAARWSIEVWHRVLKSGCKIEERQLQCAERLKRALSVYSVVAWRILYATMLGRECPNLACDVLLESTEWQALYCATFKTKVLPERIPTLVEAVSWIAGLGGFLGRKSDGLPGPTALWRGFRRLADLTFMYQILQ